MELVDEDEQVMCVHYARVFPSRHQRYSLGSYMHAEWLFSTRAGAEETTRLTWSLPLWAPPVPLRPSPRLFLLLKRLPTCYALRSGTPLACSLRSARARTRARARARRYKIDTTFVHLPASEALEQLSASLEKIRTQVDALEEEKQQCEDKMDELKKELYAKFGSESLRLRSLVSSRSMSLSLFLRSGSCSRKGGRAYQNQLQ